jgi:hypothetical protein
MRSMGTQLEQQLQVMSEENRRLQAAAQQLQAAAAAGSAPPVNVLPLAGTAGGQRPLRGSGGKLKAPKLAMFTGYTSGFNQVDIWLRNVKKHFDHYGIQEFPDDETKIQFAVMYLDGPALEWWDSLVAGEEVTTYEEFVRHLHERYRPRLAANVARQLLSEVRQTGSVQSLCHKMQSLFAHIPTMHEDDKIFNFKKALHPQLAGKVAEKEPASLHEAMNIAAQAEPYVHVGKSSSKMGAQHFGKGGYYGGRNGAAASSSSSSAVPMEVNHIGSESELGSEKEFSSSGPVEEVSNEPHQLLAMMQELKAQQQSLAAVFQKRGADQRKSGNNKVPGITKEEFERCRKDGLCLKCKQAGHLARDCNKPVQRLKW